MKKNMKVVVDTSVLDSITIFEILKQNFSKVILTLPTINELDKHKKSVGVFGYNVRKMAADCAADKTSEFYQVVNIRKTENYVDDNLIEFLKYNTDEVCLLTSDNILASKCKAFNIQYFFPWDFEQYRGEEKVEVKEKSAAAAADDDDEISIAENNKVYETRKVVSTITNTYLSYGNMYIDAPANSKNIRHIIISADGYLKSRQEEGTKLDIQDLVLVLTYDKLNKQIKIAQYEVIEIAEKNNSKFIRCDRISKIEEIQEMVYGKEIKEEIIEYYHDVTI